MKPAKKDSQISLFERVMYWIRPLKLCKGQGCYVDTPGRKNGVPYCLSCREENNPIDERRI